jgi:hypothetical protein
MVASNSVEMVASSWVEKVASNSVEKVASNSVWMAASNSVWMAASNSAVMVASNSAQTAALWVVVVSEATHSRTAQRGRPDQESSLYVLVMFSWLSAYLLWNQLISSGLITIEIRQYSPEFEPDMYINQSLINESMAANPCTERKKTKLTPALQVPVVLSVGPTSADRCQAGT